MVGKSPYNHFLGQIVAARRIKLTQRSVESAKPEERRYALTDTEIPGFRLVVAPTGRKSFELRYRVGGGRTGTQRSPKIGESPAMKAEAARRIALDWSATVRQGGDPSAQRKEARNAPRMDQLLERYFLEHARPHKKASSIAEDERLIRIFIRPALGSKKVRELTRSDIDSFHKSLADRPYRANRSVSLLSKAFNLAEVWGWRPDSSNPCRHIQKFKEVRRTRFLSEAELAALGNALRCAESGELGSVSPYSLAAIRLLLLTGARRGEILGLRWTWIDWENGRAMLPDSKTGEKVLHLPPPALSILSNLRQVENNPYVIAGTKAGARVFDLKGPWNLVRSAANLEDVRIHDLRHSFASVGAGSGHSLRVIGALLGHTQAATTQRYAHLSDDPLRAAATQISDRISMAMDDVETSISVVTTTKLQLATKNLPN